MQQMFRYGMMAAFLLLCTWQDIRTKTITIEPVLLFGTAGIVLHILTGTSWQACAGGILPGMGVLLFGRLSQEQIGYGDGIVLCVAGLFLSWKETLGLLMMALFLCALVTVGMFFLGRLKRHTSYPFLPFLTAAYGIYLFPKAAELLNEIIFKTME